MLFRSTHQIVSKQPLPGEAYACKLDPKKEKLYISCWGCDQVLIYDVQQQKISGSISVGDNPNELLFNRSGSLLFVANANDNSVSVIDVAKSQVTEVLNTALYPDAPIGSAPNGLTLSKNEKTLYVANADNNSLAVFDLSKPGSITARGFIPVGWYPTHVKCVGKKLFVTNGKGFTSMANPYGPNPLRKKEEVIYQKGDTTRAIDVQYIAGLFKGTMSVIDEPDESTLKRYTSQIGRAHV